MLLSVSTALSAALASPASLYL